MIAVPMPLRGPAEAEVPGSWHAQRQLDLYLSERSWPIRPGLVYVMTAGPAAVAADPALPASAEFGFSDEPDEAWLSMYRHRGQQPQQSVARTVLMSAPAQAFASIRDGASGAVLSIARLSVDGAWAGITAVQVHGARRRAGLGTALTARLAAEAARRGARQVFLQVEADNAAALALYERCGFSYSHRYHYRVAP
jgi:ribosomal protein S18 acetylase RimI-like enzyme